MHGEVQDHSQTYIMSNKSVLYGVSAVFMPWLVFTNNDAFKCHDSLIAPLKDGKCLICTFLKLPLM